jgi:hypothetical protein
LSYEYDFGDSWEHEILVEEIREPESRMAYPVCIAEARLPAGGRGRGARLRSPPRVDYRRLEALTGARRGGEAAVSLADRGDWG